jgi:hypothetical protein
VALAWPQPAGADTVTITSGFFEILDWGTSAGSPFRLVGSDRFTMQGTGAGTTFGIEQSCQHVGCLPGQLVSLSLLWGGLDLRGTVTLDGVTYALSQASSYSGSAILKFEGSVVMPPFNGPMVALTAPFQFSGSFDYPTGESVPIESIDLVGSGLVTAVFERQFIEGLNTPEFRYVPIQTRYEFGSVSSVPEPSTCLLITTGVLTLIRQRHLPLRPVHRLTSHFALRNRVRKS